MVRAQIQFTEEQLEALRHLSGTTGRSVSDLVRESVDDLVKAHSRPDRAELMRRALSVAGKYRSGPNSTSVDHDAELAKAFRR